MTKSAVGPVALLCGMLPGACLQSWPSSERCCVVLAALQSLSPCFPPGLPGLQPLGQALSSVLEWDGPMLDMRECRGQWSLGMGRRQLGLPGRGVQVQASRWCSRQTGGVPRWWL